MKVEFWTVKQLLIICSFVLFYNDDINQTSFLPGYVFVGDNKDVFCFDFVMPGGLAHRRQSVGTQGNQLGWLQ